MTHDPHTMTAQEIREAYAKIQLTRLKLETAEALIKLWRGRTEEYRKHALQQQLGGRLWAFLCLSATFALALHIYVKGW